MKFDLKEFLNKKVMVKLFNGKIQAGKILRSPDEGVFRFQYSTVESKSCDSYGGYWDETMLFRQYTANGLHIPGGSSNRGLNIVDIYLTEEPKMPITMEEAESAVKEVKKREVSNHWATVLTNFIDEIGGDGPSLWQWKGITPTPEKVVECL